MGAQIPVKNMIFQIYFEIPGCEIKSWRLLHFDSSLVKLDHKVDERL